MSLSCILFGLQRSFNLKVTENCNSVCLCQLAKAQSQCSELHLSPVQRELSGRRAVGRRRAQVERMEKKTGLILAGISSNREGSRKKT